MRMPPEPEKIKTESVLNYTRRFVDFSEYEWMEFIEEFDSEIIRMMEEEWFYEQVFTDVSRDQPHCEEGYVLFDDGSCYLEKDLIMHFMPFQLVQDDALYSSLNPDAPEFVPKSES